MRVTLPPGKATPIERDHRRNGEHDGHRVELTELEIQHRRD